MAKLLRNSNSKLGVTVFGFSIVAGETCPGASEACLAVCYAKKGEAFRPSVKVNHIRNLERVKADSSWKDDIINQINTYGIKTVRIHPDGDFFEVSYVLDWIDIVNACPGTKFFGYTKSWRVKGMLVALDALRALPNVSLLASWDSTWTKSRLPNGVWPTC